MTDDVRFVMGLVGEVAHISTLRRFGLRDLALHAAVRDGRLRRVRRGWYASPAADHDQLRAVVVHARIGCVSALARFGVWAGESSSVLHLQVPRNAARLGPDARPRLCEVSPVWHPKVPERRRRTLRLSTSATPVLHWRRDGDPANALDWVVSVRAALTEAVRCLEPEHAQAAVDSAIAERALSTREAQRIVADAPQRAGLRVDEYSPRLESGAESLFVRRLLRAGFTVEPQLELAGTGRFDGLIEGCVLYEVDGWAHHRSRERFFGDRDRTLVAQSFGVPVIRVSAQHVLRDWPTVAAAVERTVADARALRADRPRGRLGHGL
jgi:very-short-patch-repair endonuclease